ncbi:unnamed protein product [Caenorhabditis sp. 36 PRJEB53466]|nr:unnamed protein product [Caenorhabditis sp. 36 PRJEB53466]
MENEGDPEPAVPVQEEKENEEEGTITVRELVELEEAAEVLFAAQDPAVCTFPEGYKPRQTVFTCLTCTPAPQMAGVCYGCSLHCHEGHEMVELYTKRKFRCDCGNSKFGDKKCTLYEEKDADNMYNLYNHNYHGKFCTCEVFYPDDESTFELFQCEICEDWFHENHLNYKQINLEEGPSSSEAISQGEKKPEASIICVSCVRKMPFVMQIPTGTEPFCHSKLSAEQIASVDPASLAIEKFRSRLCKCTECIRVYERADVEFLLDDEDDMATFESESRRKVAENKTTEAEEMREIVKEVGMEGARVFFAGLNDFKRDLTTFISTAGKDGKAITAEQVTTFFDALKEDRLQRKRPRYE